ncbi:hypothetical protein HK102_008514 [Quaeritorhiza haematococci]|nr:hypothetical protein HK102_008514 [Quaeritorhiza haematococci]
MLEIEMEIFRKACLEITAQTPELIDMSMALAELDVAASTAYLALRRVYCRPEIVEESVFDVKAGRHPVVEVAQLHRLNQPSMGGKSTFLRLCAIMSVVAQAGLYVPATSARLGIVDRIFSRLGSVDYIVEDLSTFMVEMTETAAMMKRATPRSLIIMDEIGRGTGVLDGIAIAYGISRYLYHDCQCRTIFATHYADIPLFVKRWGFGGFEMDRGEGDGDGDSAAKTLTFAGSAGTGAGTVLTNRLSETGDERTDAGSVVCYTTAALTFEDDEVKYRYRLEPGVCDGSFSIEVADEAVMPQKVIEWGTWVRKAYRTNMSHFLLTQDHPKEYSEFLERKEAYKAYRAHKAALERLQESESAVASYESMEEEQNRQWEILQRQTRLLRDGFVVTLRGKKWEMKQKMMKVEE